MAMLKIIINPWVPEEGLTHTHTDYEISTDAGMVNLTDSSYYDPSLSIFYSSVGTIENTTYWGRARRVIIDEEGTRINTNWIGPKDITTVYDGRRLEDLPEIAIDIPRPIIDLESLYDTELDFFTVKVGDIRADRLGQKSSSWVMKDEKGEIKFRSLNDSVNLKTISVDKKLLGNSSRIYMACSQQSNNYMASLYGSDTAIVNNVEYVVTSNLVAIPYDSDYLFSVESTNGVDSVPIEKINVIDSESGKTVHLFEEQLGNGFVIPHNLLVPDTNYYIDVYLLPTDKNVSEVKNRYVLQIQALNNKFTTDKDFRYLDKLEVHSGGLDVPTLPMSGSIEVDNSFLFFDTFRRKFRFYQLDYDTQSLVFLGEANSQIEFAFQGDLRIINLPRNQIAIYGVDLLTQTLSLWLIKVSIKYHTLSVISTITFPDNNILFGIDSLTHSLGTDFVFLLTKNDENITLNKINYKSGEIETSPVPISGELMNLDSIDYNKLILISSDSESKTQIYDSDLEEWGDLLTLPEEFKNREMKSIIGKDGRIKYFAIDGAQPLGLSFNSFDYRFNILECDSTNQPFLSLVRLQTGNVILFNGTTTFIYT